MVASVEIYWNDETFSEITKSYSFGEVQQRLKEIDEVNWKYQNAQ